MEDYEKAISLMPNNGEAYIRRGIVHLKKGEYQDAVDDIEYGFELNPEFKETAMEYLEKAKKKLNESNE